MSRVDDLSPEAFQQLAGALAVRALGAGVSALGKGPDGGRDFYFRGRLSFETSTTPAREWDGYTVFQVKMRQRDTTGKQTDAQWLVEELVKELRKWADPGSGRAEVPDQLLFISNARLSGVATRGGHDVVHARLDSTLRTLQEARDPATRERALKIKHWHIWNGNDIDLLLGSYPDVRERFRGLLTAEDVISSLSGITGALSDAQIREALRIDVRASLIHDRHVYFNEAGVETRRRTPLADVVIDIPVLTESGNDARALRVLAERSDLVHTSDVPFAVERHNTIVAAGPGNGKSTLSIFLAQIYRAAFVGDDAALGDDHRGEIEAVAAAVKRLGLPTPSNRRWPFRINLAEYTHRDRPDEGESSLLRWIAEKVARTSSIGEFKPWHLKHWLETWPWLLILDGLDEVSEPSIRKYLIRDVEAFIAEAETMSADLQVILTTRPTGFDEDIAPGSFERLDLGRFEPQEARRFGHQLIALRTQDDEARREVLTDRMDALVFANEDVRLLAQTPLQMVMLSFLVESNTTLPVGRSALFMKYYDSVFAREASKRTPVAELLSKHKPHIERLHAEAGFLLQCRSEETGGANAALTSEELGRLTRAVLGDAGFTFGRSGGPDLRTIVTAATERLVLLAPRPAGGFGFELRSLQEMFAARRMVQSDAHLPDLLRLTAPRPHWRNVWLFAASAEFESGQGKRMASVVNAVRDANNGSPNDLFASVLPPGPALAADLIDQGVVDNYPKHLGALLDEAARMLTLDAPCDPLVLARCFARAAAVDPTTRKAVLDRLRAGTAGDSRSSAITKRVLGLMPSVSQELGVADTVSTAVIAPQPAAYALPSMDDSGETTRSARRDRLTELQLSEAAGARLATVIDALEKVQPPTLREMNALEQVLASADDLGALDLVLDGLADPHVAQRLRDLVVRETERRPIGDQLMSLVNDVGNDDT